MFELHLPKRGFWLTEDAQCKQCFNIAEVTVMVKLVLTNHSYASCSLRFTYLNLQDINIGRNSLVN